MGRDPDFTASPTPKGRLVGVSNLSLLLISSIGFGILGIALYVLILRPSAGATDGDNSDDGELRNYEEQLDGADVRTLNRAQRRLRARNHMKKNRRMAQQEVAGRDAGAAAAGVADQLLLEEEMGFAAGDGGAGHEGDEQRQQQHLSRKERARLAKTAEKEERQLYEEERREARKFADAKAAVDRREREEERVAAAEEERRRREAEGKERELAEHNEWVRVFAFAAVQRTVKEFVAEAQQRKVWPVNDIADTFVVTPEQVVTRLEQLMSENRLAGSIVSQGTLIYIGRSEMQELAKFLLRNGNTSLPELSDEVRRIVSLPAPEVQ
jgi:hypothetical protein